MYPQFVRNWPVLLEVNSGPPSEDSSSSMPKVTKIRLRQAISPAAPSTDFSAMGQLEYQSTITR